MMVSELAITDHEARLQHFALMVYRYCVRVRGSVTSWIRTPGRNLFVGGLRNSQHLAGLAVDVVLDEPLTHPIDTDARHRLARELGLRLIIEVDHDHLEFR